MRVSPRLLRVHLPVLMGLGLLLGVPVLRWRYADDEQRFIMRLVLWIALGALALTGWALLFAPGRLRTRLGVFALVLLLVVGLGASLRIDGVSGNLVPIVRFRWTPRSELVAPVPLAPASGAADADAAPRAEPLAGAADFPQFLGPRRNATLTGLHLETDWEARPPRTLWRRPIGAGWSSFAVAGHRAVTQEQRGNDDLVVCYDLATGTPLWSTLVAGAYTSSIGGAGPRATPTIHDDLVYTLGPTGILCCLQLADGAILWKLDTVTAGGTRVNDWGNAGSPLVDGERVLVGAGGLLACDRRTGAVLWHAADDAGARHGSSYASPAIHDIAGVRQVVMLNPLSASGHDPETGRRLWTYDWPGETPKVAQLVPVSADELVITSGYGVGAARFALEPSGDDALEPRAVWRSRHMKAKFTNIVHHHGNLYGLDDGILACVDAETGRRRWKSGRYGHGQLLLVDELLLVVTEEGAIVLVDAVPEEPRERARFQAIEGKTWNTPALAGPYLLVRNAEEAACFELPRLASAPTATETPTGDAP